MKINHEDGSIHNRRRIRFSGLLFRITVSLAGVILLVLAALGFYSGNVTSNALSASAEAALQDGALIKAKQIESFLRQSRSDLFFLNSTPPIKGILRAQANGGKDPLDGSTTQVWKKRLAKIFQGMAQNKSQYAQIRLIDKSGQELVRVDSDGSNAKRVPEEKLQNKKTAGYFRDTMKLRVGQLYVSTLNLNKERGKIQVPYVPVIRYATPIFDSSGSRQAILITNIFAKNFIADLKKSVEGRDFYLVNADGYFLVNPDESKEWGFMLNRDTKVQNDFAGVAKRLLSGEPGTIKNFQEMVVSHVPVSVKKEGGRIWTLIVAESRSKVLAAVNDFWVIFALFVGGTFVLSVLAAFLLARSITVPIGKIVEMIGRMREGDLQVRMQMDRNDEIGIIASTLDSFADNLSDLVGDIRHSSTQVSSSSISLTDISNVLAAGSEQNAMQANNVSTAAEQLSGNVNSVATAVEEMSATIKEITGTVVKSSATTEQAVERSGKAAEVIKALSTSSDAIGRVTELISSIAAQTNILALNATIEAARAGDAGKGFAVVANEVKDLAKETSRATEEIVAQIGEMQANAKDAVLAIDEIGAVMNEVNSYSATVSAAIEEQSSTTAEIARSMNEAATGVHDIVSNVTGVADSATEISKKSAETKDAADSLTNVASGLAKLVAAFKTGSSTNGGARASSQGDSLAGMLSGGNEEPVVISPEEAVEVAHAQSAEEGGEEGEARPS